MAAEGNILCEHARVIQRSHHLPPNTIYDWRHYLAVVQRKPGALRNGAPFLELPHAFRQLQDHMLRKPPSHGLQANRCRATGGDREVVDILALVLHHDEQAVLTAVELALAEGVPTKTHVLNLLNLLNLLNRLVDGKVIGGPPLDTPQALALHREPKANVELNRPLFTGGQNSRRIARYGTDTKEEDREAVFTRVPRACGAVGDGTPR